MRRKRLLLITVSVSLLLIASASSYHTILPRHGTIEFPGEGTYVGQLRGMTFHGFGTWRTVFGVTYVGEFRDGSFHGHGTMIFANGSVYIGGFKHGQMHGEGRMVFPGHVHEGVWEADEYTGGCTGCDHGH